MRYAERMRTVALLAQEPEVRELMLLAADRIEELSQWKLLWAQTHEELAKVREELETIRAAESAKKGERL